MDNTQIEKNFETYINLLETKIKRDGMERLIKWLKARDTKVAPASAKYHCEYAGGLVEHSLNVYERWKKLVNLQYPIKKVEVNGKVEQLGSCPYSDSLLKGSKAAVKIYGFDYLHGYTDMKKIILN